MDDLRVELQRVEPLARVRHCGAGAVSARGDRRESRRRLDDAVAVAHPHGGFARNAVEQRVGHQRFNLRLAVFARFAALHLSAERLRHQLHPVAYPEHGHAQSEHSLVYAGRVLREHAVGPAGQDDPRVSLLRQLRRRRRERQYLRIDVLFAHAPRYQLRVLRSIVQYSYLLHLQPSSFVRVRLKLYQISRSNPARVRSFFARRQNSAQRGTSVQ